MKHPVKYARDSGQKITLGDLADKIVLAIESGDIDIYCDVVDEEFIWGCWGHVLGDDWEKPRKIHPVENTLLNKDIRGLILKMYELGIRRSVNFVKGYAGRKGFPELSALFEKVAGEMEFKKPMKRGVEK